MSNKELYHPYRNKNGKMVYGAAALNHYIHTVKGGIQNYNDEIGLEYLSEFVKEHSDIINANLVKKPKETNLKLFRKILKGRSCNSSLVFTHIKPLLPT